MGIYINLFVSKAVTKKEWEDVYEKTLELIEYFPFVERQKIKIHDIDTICLVKTKERERTNRYSGVTHIGWNTIGDSNYMATAENYYLPRDIVGNGEVLEDAGDALLTAISYYCYDIGEEGVRKKSYSLWGNKTQGEPYHIYLLSVAAFIANSLGEKAFVYGDITKGQLENAVEIANQYLDVPIGLPDCCTMEKFLERIKKLPFDKTEQLKIFETFYLGTQGKEFGEFIRKNFSTNECEAYWRQEFENCRIGTRGFNEKCNKYLLWGFDLQQLFEFIEFSEEDGVQQYETVVKRILDAKLYLKEKNCKDVLEIDQEEKRPYSTATLFAQFVFGGAMNKKIDRYIPLAEIQRSLREALDDKCNVDGIVEEYFREDKKEDISDTFYTLMETERTKMEKQREQFDIYDSTVLRFYEEGDTVVPELMEAVKRSRKFLDSLLEEEEYKDLLQRTARERCEWLVEHNRYFLIRDTDWEKIFTDIESNTEAFGRYYSIFRIEVKSSEIENMCIAFLLNDELYFASL